MILQKLGKNDEFTERLNDYGRNSGPKVSLACVAGGISRASAFVLVAMPLTLVAKPWEDW